ncbi:cysteine-rich repeat secretory protein 38-like [Malania oleifera]|uniref:cysteine-rich repeat secretory protein 38-like n=1 Tax=Malania oleifera TaxID=397392 RepID=UPI0025AE5C3D|nr:cysteine-rich repeat secretory protein 38-like [Malania oleifera]
MSSSSTLASSLLFLSFALLFRTLLGADSLFHYCPSSSDNFTANGAYETNLNALLGALYYKAPPTGFGLDYIGSSPDHVNGLALCRGDVPSADCKSCVALASGELRRLCPYNKRSSIWYDNCFVRYSNEDFFGKIDNEIRVFMWNTQNVSYPTYFNQKTRELLGQLSEEASVAPRMFATGESELDGSQKLYGLVQCTRDLSIEACKQCLDGAVGELPNCCDGKQGGRVLGGSCSIRYEVYPFYNNA